MSDIGPGREDGGDGEDHRRRLICRSLVDERSIIGRSLGYQHFADPAWDMLLFLYGAKKDGITSYIWAVCTAANVPMSTAYRVAIAMVGRGDVLRQTDTADHRRVLVSLSDEMEAQLDMLLDRIDHSRTDSVRMTDHPTPK